jgi:hypothetical protein
VESDKFANSKNFQLELNLKINQLSYRASLLNTPKCLDFSAWMYFGLIGGLLFIVIQLFLLVDFGHAWNELW